MLQVVNAHGIRLLARTYEMCVACRSVGAEWWRYSITTVHGYYLRTFQVLFHVVFIIITKCIRNAALSFMLTCKHICLHVCVYLYISIKACACNQLYAD